MYLNDELKSNDKYCKTIKEISNRNITLDKKIEILNATIHEQNNYINNLLEGNKLLNDNISNNI